jgi:hypothetical protein
MKKTIKGLLLFGFVAILISSCEKNKQDEAPQLPPYESMVVDFSKFTTTGKSASGIDEINTTVNYVTSAITVGYWNLILGLTLAVPVASFYQSFSHSPEFLGNKTWQWEYDCTGFANTYHSRMLGMIRESDIKWEMYISKDGVGGHDEFLWFEGTSNLNGMDGQWKLCHSYADQEGVLQIDWSKTGDEIGAVTYTYIHEADNADPNQLTVGSYLSYGLTENALNAFYTVVYNTRNRTEEDMTVNIEWSSTEYNGRIKAEHYFHDALWHCWDSQGNDVVCE